MSNSDCRGTGSLLKGRGVRDTVMPGTPSECCSEQVSQVDPETDRPVVEKKREEIHHLYHKVINKSLHHKKKLILPCSLFSYMRKTDHNP